MFPELPEARMEMRRLIGFYPLTNKSVNQQKNRAANIAAKLISG
jgi:hypothetical protein